MLTSIEVTRDLGCQTGGCGRHGCRTRSDSVSRSRRRGLVDTPGMAPRVSCRWLTPVKVSRCPGVSRLSVSAFRLGPSPLYLYGIDWWKKRAVSTLEGLEGGRQFRAEIAHIPRVPERSPRGVVAVGIGGFPVPPFVVEALLELHRVVDLPRHLRHVPHFALDPLLVFRSVRLAGVPNGRAAVGLASVEP